ncbi:MAG: ATP-binding cassette domain-containing protein [Phycisphaerae bacterium]
MPPQIVVEGLTKTFRVPHRAGGFRAALGSLVRRQYREVRAVRDVSFAVSEGEIVGFLGPNGAGKTTTLKMLCGLLHPTSGTARIMGHVPWRRQSAYLRRISMVMGQRSQLTWDIPAMDSYLVMAGVYGVPRPEFESTLRELTELLDLEPLLKKPVRTLSLGERMKCELAASLLHQPAVMFLDEPTIGVDITMQARIRQFIQEYNRRRGATIILTSHYMADVTTLCKRVIIIHHGRLLYDGPLAELSARLAPFKVITIDLDRDVDGFNFAALGCVLTREPRKAVIRVPKDQAPQITGRLLAELPVLDLTIEDPPIEDVIERVFKTGPPGEETPLAATVDDVTPAP